MKVRRLSKVTKERSSKSMAAGESVFAKLKNVSSRGEPDISLGITDGR